MDVARETASIADLALLTSKLFVPLTRSSCIERPRLDERLDSGLEWPLTLVCAGAGFGKTTLVADWLRRRELIAGWISMDAGDADPETFLRYLVAAFEAATDKSAHEVISELDVQGSDPRLVAVEFINLLAEHQESVLIVLDDLHLAASDETYALLGFLIASAPPNLHFYVMTRVDPPLSLSRLRGRGLLVELRGVELRFRSEEAREFLVNAMGIKLSQAAIKRIEARTEGWAVGLQMAALSLRGSTRVEEFVEEFSEGDRYVLDYLMEEVLTGMSESIREFVLQTSILDELTVPLVNALTGRDDGEEMLSRLHVENLFLVPLDHAGKSFRYHHLFSTLLRHELGAELEETGMLGLHKRASEAHEGVGTLALALEHALQAREWDRAEALYKRRFDVMSVRGGHRELETLLEKFPPEELNARPRLLVKLWRLTRWSRNDKALARARQKLRDALTTTPLPAIEAELEVFTILDLLLEGVTEGMGERIAQALGYIPEDEDYVRGALLTHLAQYELQLERNEQAYAIMERIERAVKPGADPFMSVWPRWRTTEIALIIGDIDKAARVIGTVLRDIKQVYGDRPPRASAMAWASHAQVLYERGELEPASFWLRKALELMDPLKDAVVAYVMVMTQARVEAFRDPLGPGLDVALSYFNKLMQAADMPYFKSCMEAWKVRLALSPHTTLEARPHVTAWLGTPGIRERSAPVFGGIPFATSRKEFANLILARCLCFTGELDEAEELASKHVDAAELGQRTICAIDGLLVLAEVATKRGDSERAKTRVARAVELAHAQSLVAPFLEHQANIVELAFLEAQRRGREAFAKRLRALCTRRPGPDRAQPLPTRVEVLEVPIPTKPPVIAHALSERELEVLEHVSLGCSNAEIGRKLFVASSTIKKHLEHVYDKLGVRRRTQAVARARELRLLS